MTTKPIAWSHTALTQFVNCPEQYHQVKILRAYPFQETPETVWGNEVHKAFELRLLKGQPLPNNMVQYEPLMQQLAKLPGQMFGEQQLAVDRDFNPVNWFAKNAWCRGIVDAMWFDKHTCYAVDYKTGKYKEESDQLALFAALIFQHHPDIATVHTKFLWTQHLGTEKQSISRSFKRSEMADLWMRFIPVVKRIQQAVDTDVWPMRPSGLCGWCPVSKCPNWFDRYKKR